MGLCKCPKRKVTNLFCFEHRVNVCEACLIANHESCVVQTYVSWLTDSDFDPHCLLCTRPLINTETVRLKCLHVFHWACLNQRLSQLPPGSSLASFKCPSCLDHLFPASNQAGPVVEKLRGKLSTVNWGRAGIGLDLRPEFETQAQLYAANGTLSHPPSLPASGRGTPAAMSRERDSSFSINMEADPMEMNTFTSRSKVSVEDRRPLLGAEVRDEDHPDQKYARRFGGDRHTKIRQVPRSVKRITVIVLIAALVIFIFIFFGRRAGNANDNPLFDPHANPNIRIADSNHI